MRKSLLFFTISVTVLAFLGCAGKDILKDPGVMGKNRPQYMVNKEGILLPTFLNMPSVNTPIDLVFEKPSGKPVKVAFQYGVDGWKAPNGKIISDGVTHFGIALDFTTGGVYEIPKRELDNILSEFTADAGAKINAVYPSKDGGIFTKMAVVDVYGNFNKQELKYMNMLNSAPVGNFTAVPSQVVQGVEENADRMNMPSANDFVVSGRPVISAAAGGQYDRLLKTLAAGGNINEQDPRTGNNALINSIKHASDNISNLLIDRGINVNHANLLGQTALHAASKEGFYDISKKLTDKGANVNAKDKDGNTPLIYAAASPNPMLTDLLIDSGARVEDRNNKGETALAAAVYAGNTQTLQNLVKKGADITTKDNNGKNLIMKAVDGGNRVATSMLADLGVSAQEADNEGNRPIHSAINKGYDDIAFDLLDRGVQVDAQDSGGNSPLILAANKGNIATVNKLLNYSPDVNLSNKEGMSAYDIATEKGYDGIRRTIGGLMSDRDAMTETLFSRALDNDMAGVEAAISKGARINSPDVATGNNILFISVAGNNKKMTSLLISKGADVNHKNARGNTPLIVAVTSADKAMAELLINAGAKVNEQNSTGDTAIIWAVKLKKADILRSLLLAGANPNIKNNDGVSPYLIAENEGTADILKVLQGAGAHK